MTSKKVVNKTEKRERVAPVKPAPVVIDEHIPAQDAKALQAMLRTLLLNDARARLEQAKEDGNPDAIIACMDEVFKLEEEGKA